jgi:hypothetical protein
MRYKFNASVTFPADDRAPERTFSKIVHGADADEARYWARTGWTLGRDFPSLLQIDLVGEAA